MRTTLPWILFCLALTRLPASTCAQDINYRHVVVDASYPKRVHCKTVGDINSYGRPDVLAANAAGDGLFWYEATADPKKGQWIEHIIDADVDYVHTFKVVDMNRDGELDLVASEMEQSRRKRVGIYWNLGKSLAWRLQVVGASGSHNIRVAGLNGDGYLDVIRANHGVPTPVEAWLSQAVQRPARQSQKGTRQ